MAELTASVEETATCIECYAIKDYERVALNKIPHLHIGQHIIISRTALGKWLFDMALAEVKTEAAPPERPVPVLQVTPRVYPKHWSEVPGCGGRKRKQGAG